MSGGKIILIILILMNFYLSVEGSFPKPPNALITSIKVKISIISIILPQDQKSRYSTLTSSQHNAGFFPSTNRHSGNANGHFAVTLIYRAAVPGKLNE